MAWVPSSNGEAEVINFWKWGCLSYSWAICLPRFLCLLKLNLRPWSTTGLHVLKHMQTLIVNSWYTNQVHTVQSLKLYCVTAYIKSLNSSGYDYTEKMFILWECAKYWEEDMWMHCNLGGKPQNPALSFIRIDHSGTFTSSPGAIFSSKLPSKGDPF